jgi:hypothetical protein
MRDSYLIFHWCYRAISELRSYVILRLLHLCGWSPLSYDILIWMSIIWTFSCFLNNRLFCRGTVYTDYRVRQDRTWYCATLSMVKVSSQLQAPLALPQGKSHRKPNEYDAGRVTEPDWTFWRRDQSLARDGDWTQDSPKRSLVTIITGLSWLPVRYHEAHVTDLLKIQLAGNIWNGKMYLIVWLAQRRLNCEAVLKNY